MHKTWGLNCKFVMSVKGTVILGTTSVYQLLKSKKEMITT